jgi:ribulose-phosphate 3-epimerase
LKLKTRNKLKEFLEGLDMYTRDNIEIGIALNTTTDISEIESMISLVDFVQCMGIEKIGFQGEPFDERVLKHIKELRLRYPDVIISIDGSVNQNTAPLLVQAGVNRLVVGSLLMESYGKRNN